MLILIFLDNLFININIWLIYNFGVILMDTFLIYFIQIFVIRLSLISR